MRKFVDKLPGLGPAGANNIIQAHGSGQYIPVAIADTAAHPGSDYYEIALVEYSEKMHSDLPAVVGTNKMTATAGGTKLRGYRQTNTSNANLLTPLYLGPVIVATKGTPVRILFRNSLPAGTGGDLFIPTDLSVMGAGPFEINFNPETKVVDGNSTAVLTYGYFTQNRATLHLHGGKTPWISDGTPHQWITPAGETTAYPKGVSVALGGLPWLAAPFCYGRRSGAACLYCDRRDSTEGWTSPDNAARWGRIAVYVAMVAPVFYALTRYVWALGFPLGMSEELFRPGQESGKWIGGALFLGNFILLGAFLMLGLVQRWGEVFPRWMIGLAGRRVPIALAVIPASLASVLLIVGGIGIWSGLTQMGANAAAAGAEGWELVEEIIFQLGPTLLFPVWGVALAVAALGYYYRGRGP